MRISDLPHRALLSAFFGLLLAGGAFAQSPRVLSDFENPAAWTMAPSDGVALSLHRAAGEVGGALRLDIDFQGRGGYAIIRRELDLALPANYGFTFRIRGTIPANNLEFKLVDPSGDNVWWVNRRMFDFPSAWQTVTIRKRHVSFAWGPAGSGDMERVGAIEIAITAGSGGKGSVWIDELTFRQREPERPYDLVPIASASSRGSSARAVLDGSPGTEWVAAGSGRQLLALDFLREREYGGAVIDWGRAHAPDYDVEISSNLRDWTRVAEIRGSNGGRDYIFLPEAESRYFRIRMTDTSPAGVAIRDISIEPLPFSESRNTFFRRVASDAPRGSYPKYLGDVQSYWTVAGAPADEQEILVNEEGMTEVGGAGGFSIEPFVHLGGSRFVTWADVETSQSLDRDVLPIPSVTWRHADFTLTTTAYAGGAPGASSARIIYTLTNTSTSQLKGSLYAAVRPFQVNPSWQFLGIPGGWAPIDSLELRGANLLVNGDRPLTADPAPTAGGVSTFARGSTVEYLRANRLPPSSRVNDPFRSASGAIQWSLDLAPESSESFSISVPLHSGSPPPPSLDEVRATWSEIVGRTRIDLPPSAKEVEKALESNLAYILVNQDGPAIQPGSRSYDRSWIRDGALTSAALMRLGELDAVRRFIEWYAPYQFENGKVPCCVDSRGSDPVPENDSHGQLIYVIAEYVRHTGDFDLAHRLWPHVAAAVGYMEDLRSQRMTDEYRTPEREAYYGLLPESISHEGYSAKPMHSYWDQFFALKGYKDAAWLADGLIGEVCATAPPARDGDVLDEVSSCGALERSRLRYEQFATEFRGDLLRSLEKAMAMHDIDYLPGAVELGDFDATSTTVAIDPINELEHLPRQAVERTFEKYWENFVARRDGTLDWENYTPYELRVIGTFIRLGWIDRAHEALRWFLADRRPAAWNHWAEVVWRDPATPKFIGDMPHTWVGSDFIRSLVDFFAYERERDDALVIAAGVPLEWAKEGVSVDGLHTHYGPLGYTMQPEGDGIRVRIDEGLSIPPGGIVVQPPFGEQVVIRQLPASFLLSSTPHQAPAGQFPARGGSQ
ncbi:MAG: discoidin domain-containing protein [Thermoanaerobaculia bacterium]